MDKYKELGYRNYNYYLKGVLWKTIREKVIVRDNRTCQICEKKEDVNVLNVHHIRYDYDVLLGKNLNGLITLCDLCHQELESHTKDADHKEFLLNERLYNARGLDLDDLILQWQNINVNHVVNPRLKTRMEREKLKRRSKYKKYEWTQKEIQEMYEEQKNKSLERRKQIKRQKQIQQQEDLKWINKESWEHYSKKLKKEKDERNRLIYEAIKNDTIHLLPTKSLRKQARKKLNAEGVVHRQTKIKLGNNSNHQFQNTKFIESPLMVYKKTK